MGRSEALQRFTPMAVRVAQHAKERARRASASQVGTEHLLLGLLQEPEGLAALALTGLGVVYRVVRDEVARLPVTMGEGRVWSAEAREALERALDEAAELNAALGRPGVVDTEHLLLALTRAPTCAAMRVLRVIGIEPTRARQEVLRLVREASAAVPLLHAEVLPFPSLEEAPAPAPAGPAPMGLGWAGLRLTDVNTFFGYHPRTGVTTTLEDVRRAAERWGVRTAYIYHLNALLYGTRAGNEETLAGCSANGFFRPVAVLCPTAYRPLEMATWAKERGFAVARIFPDHHGFPVDGQACRDLLAACAAARLPVMVSALAAAPANLPRALDGIRATVILTDNRYSILGEVMALAGRLPELYLEVSGVNTPDGIALLAHAFGADRLLWGSGYPLLQVGCAAMLLHHSGLTPEQTALVAHDNAQRLLGG